MNKQGTIYYLSEIFPRELAEEASKRISTSTPEEYDAWRSNARTQCQERETQFFRDLTAHGFHVGDSTIEQRIVGSRVTNVNVRNITREGGHPLIRAGTIEEPWIYVFDRELVDFLSAYSPK